MLFLHLTTPQDLDTHKDGKIIKEEFNCAYMYIYILNVLFLHLTTPQILDTNKDGKISEEEFNCASRAPFQKLDKDGGRKSHKSAFKCYEK